MASEEKLKDRTVVTQSWANSPQISPVYIKKNSIINNLVRKEYIFCIFCSFFISVVYHKLSYSKTKGFLVKYSCKILLYKWIITLALKNFLHFKTAYKNSIVFIWESKINIILLCFYLLKIKKWFSKWKK